MHSVSEQLIGLAQENSSESRRALLRQATDLFFTKGIDHQEASQELFAQVVCRVLKDVSSEVRKEYSHRVIKEDAFPKDVVLQLANDEAEVASPVLTHSRVLTSQQIVEIAQRQSQAHLLAISKREVVETEVTDVLVERGDTEVAKHVAENHGAEFSANGIVRLAKRAEAEPELRERLVGREDLSRQAAGVLVPFLDQQLRNQLVGKLKIDEAELAGFIEVAHERVEKEMAAHRQERFNAKLLVKKVKDGHTSLDEAVKKLVGNRQLGGLVDFFTGMTNLPKATISNAMFQINGMPIALTCRALGVSEETFAAVATARCERLKLPTSSAQKLLDDYPGIDPADAARVMRFVNVRATVGGEG